VSAVCRRCRLHRRDRAGEAAMSTVSLRGLGKTYPDGHVAVRGIDLEIAHGEFFVLVGPSGCGKTSVLRMMAGLEAITTGDVLVNGVSVNGVLPGDRNLAMLFQSSALYPHLTVRDNLLFPLRMARVGKRKAAAKAMETARLLGLEHHLDKKPSALSGGERQRVALGRAMVRRTDLMLMDEPMSNLDAKLRTDLRAELHAMQRRLDVTTVYVTHDQVEAMSLGDRVAVMRAGRIAQCASPIEIFRRPADTFVAQFMGSPPMNLLGATVVRDGSGSGLQIGRYRVPLDEAARRWPGIDGLIDREVIVGIRPEAFHRDPLGVFELSVRFHEHMGAVQWVHALIDAPVIRAVEPVGDGPRDALSSTDRPGIDGSDQGSTIVAAIDGHDDVNRWAPLRLSVDVGQVHLFDVETGAAIEVTVPGTDTSCGVRMPSRIS
jgi:multiple sugar transport system ATP-binding protein